MNCPVCDAPMKQTYKDTMDGWLTCEEHEECSADANHYSYEFSYGYTTVYVGDNHEEFGMVYSDTAELRTKFESDIKSAVERAKSKLQEIKQ